MTNQKAKTLLGKGAPLMLTLSPNGPSYSIDGHGTVPTKLARGLTQQSDLSGPPQGDLFLTPNEDGLFPGCSQTWQAK
jgi:hypothetical protein